MPLPDLTPIAVMTPQITYLGGTPTISFDVFNNGDTPSSATVDQLYLSTDTAISADDILITTVSVPAVAPGGLSGGGYYAGTYNYTIPGTLTPGTYYLLSRVDPSNSVAESNESNNSSVYSFTVTATAQPDLNPIAVVNPQSAAAGTTVSISFEVFNNGSVASTATTDQFYLSKDGVISVDDAFIGTLAVPGVAPGGLVGGGYYAGKFDYSVPSNLTPGTYYILSRVDAGNSVAESNEANNTSSYSFSVTAAPQADLNPIAIVNPQSVAAGNGTTMSYTVFNNGSIPSVATTDQFYISTDLAISSDDLLVTSVSIPAVSPGGLSGGGYYSGTYDLTVPSTLSPGTYYLLSRVDFTNLVSESNETDNTSLYSFTVTAPTPNAGGSGNDNIVGSANGDALNGGLGNDRIDGGGNIDTAIFSGIRSAYSISQPSPGVFTITGPDGTDTLINVEFAKFSDQVVRLLPGAGTVLDFTAPPSTYMASIRDFDGNNLVGLGTQVIDPVSGNLTSGPVWDGSSGWTLAGTADVSGSGSQAHVLFNNLIGRWAEVGTEADGKTYFGNSGWAGDTRIVGIYIDPEVTLGHAVQGGPNDSQRRFQNDLFIGNIKSAVASGDYNHDGFQEVYFSLTDGTAYLHALMWNDGNIQYANYQSAQQVQDYLAANGLTPSTWNSWLHEETLPVFAMPGSMTPVPLNESPGILAAASG